MKDAFFLALNEMTDLTNNTYIYLLVPICIIYLFLKNKLSAPKIFFVWSTLFLLFIYFCPITAKILQACFLNKIYYRTLWLIPFVPLVCYTATDILLHLRGSKRFGLFLVLLLCIILSGSYIFTEPTFHKVTNPYKLPQEVIDTADWLPDGAYIAGAPWLVPFIREYNPTITIANDRWDDSPVNIELAKEHPDLAILGPILQGINCDFIAIGQDVNMTIIGAWEDYGFHFYRGDNRCIIYINENSSFYNGEP